MLYILLPTIVSVFVASAQAGHVSSPSNLKHLKDVVKTNEQIFNDFFSIKEKILSGKFDLQILTRSLTAILSMRQSEFSQKESQVKKVLKFVTQFLDKPSSFNEDTAEARAVRATFFQELQTLVETPSTGTMYRIIKALNEKK